MKKATQNLKGDELTSAVVNLVALAIARLIGMNKIDPSKVRSKRQFMSILGKLGRTHDDAFEIHIERIPEKMATLRACVDGCDPESAVILLYTLIEGEVNTVIRMFLRIRGYSDSTISTALRGIDFKSKLDVLLPLIGVDLGPRIRQLALESQTIRNASVHFKAQPSKHTETGDSESDYETIRKKSLEFIGRNSIDSVEKDLAPFVDSCMSQCVELQQAHSLLRRFIPVE